MRRFETLMQKPVRFWEIEVNGREVRTREGVGTTFALHAETLVSDAAARSFADAEIARRRTKGFVEIKRIAEAPVEDPVTRQRELTWSDGRLRHFLRLFQDHRMVYVSSGHEFRDRRETLDTATHSFATIAEASACFERVLAEGRERARAGRRSRSDEAHPATRNASNPHLEAMCRAAPDTREPFAVYADWLIAHGDARGEIAGLALGDRPQEARGLLERQFSALWAPGVKLAFDLRHGFVRGVRIDVGGETPIVEIVQRVLASPLCVFLDAVDVERGTGVPGDWTSVLAAIAAMRLEAPLRALRFGCEHERADQPCDLVGAWSLIASLEQLALDTARGVCMWHDEPLPALRTLRRRASTVAPDEIATISRLVAPQLVHLDLEIGEYCEDAVTELTQLFAAPGLPALRHLGLVHWRITPELVASLATSRLLPRLESLDFSHASRSDLARALARHAPAFRHLASIDLSEAELDADDIARIRSKLDNVIVGPPADDLDDERYDSVDE